MADDPSTNSSSNETQVETSAHANTSAREGESTGLAPQQEPSKTGCSTNQSLNGNDHSTRSTPFTRMLVLVLFMVLLAVYLFAAPTVQLILDQFANKPKSSKLEDATILEQVRIHSMSSVVMLLFLAAGASIGSFLNVYIYRLPRYLPLLWPGSACPNCGYKIKGIDNLPILAWIGLRGRCRQCNVKISARYPAVEALVGAIFVLFFYRELLTGGKNLPVREPNIYAGVVWIIFYTKWDLVCTYLIHMFVLVLLLGWSMINFDRFRVPWLSKIGCVLLVLIAVVAFPHLNPLAMSSRLIRPLDRLTAAGVPYQVALALSGGLIGLFVGWLMRRVFIAPAVIGTVELVRATSGGAIDSVGVEVTSPVISAVESVAPPSSEASDSALTSDSVKDLYGCPARQPSQTTDASFCMLLVGVMFGPLAALTIMVIACVLQLICTLGRLIFRDRVRVPITVNIFAATVVHLILWRQIHNWFNSFWAA